MSRFVCPLFLCLFGIVHSVAFAEEPLKISGRTMGSYYSVVIDSPGHADAERLQAEIEAKFADLSRQMSNWDEDSEICSFNRSETTEWFSVSPDFARVVEEARRLHTLTEGALDVTVSPLIDI